MAKKTRTYQRNEGRRARIAAGLTKGKSLAAIAREEGVSRQTIWKQAPPDDVSQIVVEVVNNQTERLSELFLLQLHAIDRALDARVLRRGKDGAMIDRGPDHYARLAAVGRLIKLMTAGRPVPRAAGARTGK